MSRSYPDGASRYAADVDDLARFGQADLALKNMPVPRLHEGGAGATRTFFAFFDGTGNDANAVGKGDTNVELLHRQAAKAAGNDASLGTFYVRGPGTQENPVSALIDGARGGSYDARIETMYYEYCKWASARLREDPNADLSLVTVGFSRGAEQSAGFARLVAERGIEDVETASVRYNDEGLVVRASYPSVPLRSGREIAQAVALFDPVGTGAPRRYDRRLPPEVLSGLQLTALHERRDLFEGTRILDPGMTHGGRFLNVALPGCHTDIGGSYKEDGLARRAHNLVADYLNGLVDPPVFQKRHLRPDLDVIHRSVEHQSFYDDDVFRRNERRGLPEDQLRSHREIIGGRSQDRSAAARDAEPINAELDARFDRRGIEIGPVPATPAEFRDLPPARERDDLQPYAPRRSPMHLLLGPFADAESRGDPDARRAALDAYLASPMGQAFTAQVEARAHEAREAERERQQASLVQEQHAPRVRAMAL